MSTLLKTAGWSVVHHPVTNSLYIYRDDRQGEMTIFFDDNGYAVDIYAHSDKLVASCVALTADLETGDE